MQLNLTVFIQIVNFLFSYWFLRRFFFDPILKRLHKKKKIETEIVEQIAFKERELVEKERNKKDFIKLFQSRVRQEYKVEEIKPHEVHVDLSCHHEKSQIDELVQKSKKLIIEKI